MTLFSRLLPSFLCLIALLVGLASVPSVRAQSYPAQQIAERFDALSGGTLHVTITVEGQGQWSDVSSGDHVTTTIRRTYEATTILDEPLPAPTSVATGESSPIAPSAATAFQPTTAEKALAETLQARIDACGGNPTCEQAIAMEVAAQMSAQYATPGRMAAGHQMMAVLASPRFVNFSPNVGPSGPVCSGTATINDAAQGVVTEYGEGGSARVPVDRRRQGTAPVTACGDYLSIDTEGGTYSVKIGHDIVVDVSELGRNGTRTHTLLPRSLPPFTFTLPVPAAGTTLRGEQTLRTTAAHSTLALAPDDTEFPVDVTVRWLFTSRP